VITGGSGDATIFAVLGDNIVGGAGNDIVEITADGNMTLTDAGLLTFGGSSGSTTTPIKGGAAGTAGERPQRAAGRSTRRRIGEARLGSRGTARATP